MINVYFVLKKKKIFTEIKIIGGDNKGQFRLFFHLKYTENFQIKNKKKIKNVLFLNKTFSF